MAETQPNTNRCARCGQVFAAEVLVCPQCKEILTAPGQRRGPARWVIVLLICAILAVGIYAVELFWKIVVLHQY